MLKLPVILGGWGYGAMEVISHLCSDHHDLKNTCLIERESDKNSSLGALDMSIFPSLCPLSPLGMCKDLRMYNDVYRMCKDL